MTEQNKSLSEPPAALAGDAIEAALAAWRGSTEWVVEVRMQKAIAAYLAALPKPAAADGGVG